MLRVYFRFPLIHEKTRLCFLFSEYHYCIKYDNCTIFNSTFLQDTIRSILKFYINENISYCTLIENFQDRVSSREENNNSSLRPRESRVIIFYRNTLRDFFYIPSTQGQDFSYYYSTSTRINNISPHKVPYFLEDNITSILKPYIIEDFSYHQRERTSFQSLIEVPIIILFKRN